MSALRQNYRRARELASEIEVVRDALDEARRDPNGATASDGLLAEVLARPAAEVRKAA